jgi:hypothetical protein
MTENIEASTKYDDQYGSLLKPQRQFVRSDTSISYTSSRDLKTCFDVILKEAVKEDRLVKQVCYTMLSAYTNNPINLAINAPSGSGKSHVLAKVSDLFPENDIQFIADMSDKAIFHKTGYLGISDQDGKYENIEGKLLNLKESLISKTKEYKKLGNNMLSAKNELKKEIDEIQKQINIIRQRAVKVIDLSRKILIFLDTPKNSIFGALMSLLSHDKLAVEYDYVDTTSKTGIVTKTNVLVGWPAVIFAQAIDFTNHPRYEEIQRRFNFANPRMDGEKYQSAVDVIIEKNCVPDLVYQRKVVSDEQKDEAREIILNIRDDLLAISSNLKPGKNNIVIPYPHLISELLSKDNSAQDMTYANRLLNYVGLLTNINMKKRPCLEIQPIFGSDSLLIPMALYSDFCESISLINNSTGGVRPYILEWYHEIFLTLYESKSNPNSKFKNAILVTEDRVAVTTQELIEKTFEITKKQYTSKFLLTEYIYPLRNLGYIDSTRSLIDGRAFIYYPVLHTANEKNINLFLLEKKNNLIPYNDEVNKNLIPFDAKTLIISKINEVRKCYSEDKKFVMLRFAEEDANHLTEEETEKIIEPEQIFDKYYSKLDIDNNKGNIHYLHDINKSPSSEEYPQIGETNHNLQDVNANNIKNVISGPQGSNNLFPEEKKNKRTFPCYYCSYDIEVIEEYEKHVTVKHPGRLAYPDIHYIRKEGLKPLGKLSEKDDENI